MSAFMRGTVLGATLVGACFAGYVMRNPPGLPLQGSQATANSSAALPSAVTVSKPVVRPSQSTEPNITPPIQLASGSRELEIPTLDFNALPPSDLQADPDPNDLGYQIIKDRMGIKTTSVLGDPLPVPEVLASAGQLPASPPTKDPVVILGPAPQMELPPVPVPTKPVLVNRRDVELEFEVSHLGSAKIVSTELWLTRDMGATWKKHAEQKGASSPFRTVLADDGSYGFRLAVVSETGKRSGTRNLTRDVKPDIQLELDTKPPVIKIFDPVPIEGVGGRIRLHWASQDKNPSPKTETIEYSADGKEWKLVNPERLPTSRFFDWQLPKGIPPFVYLRITETDAAGNVAIAMTPEKVAIDLAVPAVKITGIRVDQTKPDVGPMPRVIE